MSTIKDGTGSSREAGVDTRNRLETSSISDLESTYAVSIGNKFNINTGDITLTGTTKTTVLYLKNNDTRILVVDSVIYNCGASTGGTVNRRINVVRNPTTGGIITNANPVQVGLTEGANLNFGNTNVPDILAYKGATGEALVNGFETILTLEPTPSGRIAIAPGGNIYMPKGTTLAINYTPPTGSTTQICQFALNVYYKETT